MFTMTIWLTAAEEKLPESQSGAMASTSKSRRSEGMKHQTSTAAAAISPFESTSKSRQSPSSGKGLKRQTSPIKGKSAQKKNKLNGMIIVVYVCGSSQ